jgi:hypothetical protein
MSFQPYNPQPKKGLPVWTLAILVFASVFVVGMVIVILIGVTSNSGSLNQAASPAAIVPTAPGAPVGNFKGLGQDKVSWENEHGSAATGSLYESGKYYLMFDSAGKAWHLERNYGKSPCRYRNC